MASYGVDFELRPENPIPAGPYVLFNFSCTVSGSIGSPDPLVSFTYNNQKEIEAALETNLTESISGRVAANVNMEKMARAIRNLDANEFKDAFGLEAAFRFKIGSTLDIQAGVQWDACPFFVKFTGGKLSEIIVVCQEKVQCDFSMEGGIYFGLTPEGWLFVLKRVGPSAIKRFLLSLGPRFASLYAELIAGGAFTLTIVTVLAVAGTAALIAATAAIVNDAKTKGVGLVVVNYYKEAYIAKVYNRLRPSGSLEVNKYIRDANTLKDKMIIEGEKDALIDAEATAKQNGMDLNFLKGGIEKEKEILENYRIAWICKAIEGKGKQKTNWPRKYSETLMGMMLNKKIKDKFGIRSGLFSY
jgi:hypothetical protein